MPDTQPHSPFFWAAIEHRRGRRKFQRRLRKARIAITLDPEFAAGGAVSLWHIIDQLDGAGGDIVVDGRVVGRYSRMTKEDAKILSMMS